MGFKAEINNATSPVTPDESFRPGMVAMTAAPAAPSGFLLCDGSEYDPMVYAALFVAIGTAYNTGGETPGYFRVPNFQARTPFGVGTIGGQVWVRGTQYGDENLQTHTHTQNAHTHTVTDPGHTHTQNSHSHVVNDSGHNHVQDAHTHVQNSHNHTQDPHFHTGQAFGLNPANPVGTYFGTRDYAAGPVDAWANFNTANTTAVNIATTATNQNTTATNQSSTTGLTLNGAIAVNQSNTTGITNGNTTATNNNAGTGSAGNIPPIKVKP